MDGVHDYVDWLYTHPRFTLTQVTNLSAPIQVYGDDTFIVEFTQGKPLKFVLRTPTESHRVGTCQPFGEHAIFEDGTEAVDTDKRVLKHAYKQWANRR